MDIKKEYVPAECDIIEISDVLTGSGENDGILTPEHKW